MKRKRPGADDVDGVVDDEGGGGLGEHDEGAVDGHLGSKSRIQCPATSEKTRGGKSYENRLMPSSAGNLNKIAMLQHPPVHVLTLKQLQGS